MKILLAKPGLDGHDVGVKVLAHALTEAGFEISYTGLRKTIPQIVQAAKTRKADLIGLSILSGTHLVLCREMNREMQAASLSTPWIVGGNIPDEDVEALVETGAKAAFPTGTTIDAVVGYCQKLAGQPGEQA